MYRRHGQKLGLVFLLGDLVVTASVWFLAYYLRYAIWPAPYGIPDLPAVVAGLPACCCWPGWLIGCAGCTKFIDCASCRANCVWFARPAGCCSCSTSPPRSTSATPTIRGLGLALFLGLNACALMLVRRFVWRAIKELRSQGLNYGRAVIVGSGRMGRLVCDTICNNSWTGLEAVGFVDQPGRIEPAPLPRLGTIEQLGQIVAAHDIDHVFVALPLSRYGELPLVYQALEHLLVEVQLVPDVPNLAGMKLRTLEIDGVPFMSLRSNPQHGWCRLAKRGMDLAIGSVALLLAAPLMLLLAALIKLTSPGPVLFRQPRLGLGGRSFNMLKFRSMRLDAEQRTGPVWAHRNDLRCTPLGRFMRRWSLGRTAAVVQCAGRRHEPGRPASGARRVQPALPPRDSQLLATAPGASRHDRLGPGQRLAGKHFRAPPLGVRLVLHQQLVARARSADPGHDRVARLASSERLLVRKIRHRQSSSAFFPGKPLIYLAVYLTGCLPEQRLAALGLAEHLAA